MSVKQPTMEERWASDPPLGQLPDGSMNVLQRPDDPPDERTFGPGKDFGEDELVTDATPRTLYVRRDVINAKEILTWARSQGFGKSGAKQLTADDLHVTITFSRTPVDWMKMGSATDFGSYDDKGELFVPPGGPRMLERLGPEKDAVVLLFSNSQLCWRHEDMVRNGASWDFPEYQPHITIAYDKPDGGMDISKIEPYRGQIVLGPEIFEEVDEGWKTKITSE
jgi:hypothetical protein